MANPLTLTRPTYNATGKFGASLSGGYGQTSAAILPVGGTFTVDLWVKWSATGSLKIAAAQANAFWMGVDASGNAVANYGSGGTAVALNSTAAIGNGAWHHLELVSDAAAGLKMFVDGVLASSSATTPAAAVMALSGGSASKFDVNSFRAASASFDWPGEVDECAVWTIARHTSAFTPPAAAYSGSETGLFSLWHLDSSGADSVVSNPSTATLTGPTSGATGSTSGAFTVTLDRVATSTVIVSPVGTVGSVVFSPASPSIAVGQTTVTFTATPAADGAHAISITTAPALTAVGSPITYTTTTSAATAVTLTGPTSGSVGAASSNFTVGANGAITGSVVITPSSGGGGGTFSPTSVTINTGAPTGTFTYTAATAGAKTISVTNSGALTNPANITYTAAAAALYTRVDAVEPLTGSAIMVLIPSGASSNPYNSANPTKTIIYCHGAGETAGALLADSLKLGCVNALLDAGYILADCSAGGSVWGIQSSVDPYAGLDSYLRANYNVSGIGVWSQSMGGLAGLHVIEQTKVTGIVGWLGTYPVCNLANLYSLGTYTSAIASSYGIGAGTATYANMTYGMDPVLRSAKAFRDTPMRFYSSRSDTVVPGLNNAEVLQATVASTRREAVLVQCTGNHGDPSHFIPAEYLAFFNRCFATTTRTVSLTLTTDGTTPAASLTGLNWAVYEQALPGAHLAPIAKGASGTTNASGVFTTSFSALVTVGAVVWLVVTNSDGTTTQSPAAKAFSGAVTVA